MASLLYLLLPLVVLGSSLSSPPHPQACSYQPALARVRCQCSQPGTATSLNIKWKMFQPETCQELILSLDLSGVSHHNLTLQVKDCGQVRVGNIKSGQDIHREHQLNIQLEDVDKFIIEKQSIEEALTISSSSVGEVLIYQATLSSIPPPGLTVENADKVSLIDSVFSNTASGSISVDTVDEVEIVNNQFSRDIIEVLRTKDSPNLYISCNRLLGETVNLECATISTLHTLSSKTSMTESPLSSVPSAALDIKSERKETTNRNNILWLLLIVGLIVLTVIFICICLRRRQHKDDDDEEKNALNSNIETEKHEAQKVDAEERNVNHETSSSKDYIVVESLRDDEDIIEKVKEQEAIL